MPRHHKEVIYVGYGEISKMGFHRFYCHPKTRRSVGGSGG